MRRRKSPIAILLLFLLLIVGGFVAFVAVNGNLSPDDSSALYGGRLESGYLSAGFLITEMTNGSSKTCGVSVITNQVAITAGHCVDDAKTIRIGAGDFSTNYGLLKTVGRAVSKAGWATGRNRSDDFAILTYQNNGHFSSFAKIGNPAQGCIARVVAYGRTENPLESITHPRKSALLCVSDISVDTFRLTSEDAGICFGDSGSPVYRDGTNEVIGVIVSIIKKDEDDNEPCAIGNTAIAVRVDTQERLIKEQVQTDFAAQGVLEFPTETVVEVAEETLLEKLGLAAIQNITPRQRDTFLLVGSLAGVGILVILIGVLLYSNSRSTRQISSAYDSPQQYY